MVCTDGEKYFTRCRLSTVDQIAGGGMDIAAFCMLGADMNQAVAPGLLRGVNRWFVDWSCGHLACAQAGIETLPGQFLDFIDPRGNRIEIVYDNVRFTKAPNVLRGIEVAGL